MMHFSVSKSTRVLAVATFAAALFASGPGFADPDKDESGHGRGRGRGHAPKIEVHDNGKDYKYEYQDRRCKYEYKLNYRTGEEKVEQKGDCRGVSPRRAVYPDVDVYHEHEDDYEVVPRSSRRIDCNRDVIGAVIGGVVGGVAGSNVGSGDGRKVATVAGAVIGAVIGGNIGRRMDRADAGCAYQAFEFASPGETVYWRNPHTQMEYGITPDRLTRRSDGRECRDYKASFAGSGASQNTSSGVVCRNSNGAWEIE